MLICDDPPFAVVLPPKTGTRSLWYVLTERFPVRIEEPYHEVPGRCLGYNKGPVICTARNPYSRLVSWWNHVRRPETIPANPTARRLERQKKAARMGFARFIQVEKGRLTTAKQLLRGLEVTHWVHLENFVHDIRKLPLPGMKKAKVPHKHNSKYGDWRKLYRDQPELIQWVKENYEDDFVMGGYSMEFPG